MAVKLSEVPRLQVEAAERPYREAERLARVHSHAHLARDFLHACKLSALGEAKRLRMPLTDTEAASVGQAVALVELRRYGRMPERGEYGLQTLTLAARSVLTRHSQDWRDVDSGYRVKHGGKPVKLADVRSRDQIEADAQAANADGRPVGYLAVALARAESSDGQAVPDVLAGDTAHLASVLAGAIEGEWLAGDRTLPWKPAQRRDVVTALRLSMGASMATLSAMDGRTAMALHKSKGRGEAAIRATLDPQALIRLARTVARAHRVGQPARESHAPVLAEEALAAGWLVGEAARVERNRPKRASGTYAPMIYGRVRPRGFKSGGRVRPYRRPVPTLRTLRVRRVDGRTVVVTRHYALACRLP